MPIYAPTNLRCDSLADPIGLEVASPHLSWRVQDERPGARQTAYRIIATDADAAVSTVPLWDSGKVENDPRTHAIYAGPALPSRRRIRWRVRVWNGDGVQSPWSAAATIEMGLLDRNDWRGEWIGGRAAWPRYQFVKTFTTSEKPIRGRLYLAASASFEAEINGKVVGSHALTSRETDERAPVLYDVFDVTKQIVDGENAVGITLITGRPQLLAQLELFYADHRSETIATDGTWQFTTAGGSRSKADLDDASWRPAETCDWPVVAIVARRPASDDQRDA